MRDWKEVFGTEESQPLEIDVLSSPTTVYERKNVRQVTIVNEDGTEVTGWLRDGRELTKAEYDEMNSPATQLIMQQLSSMELDIAMLGV